MMWVILRSGKVLQYNRAESCSIEDGAFALRTRNQSALIARIPVDQVERAEFEKPCAVMREKKDLRARRTYR